MGLLRWIFEAVVLTVVVNLVLRLFTGGPAVRAGGPRPSPGRSRHTADGAGRERVGGALVRDPQCGTYVPQSRAIRVGSGPNAHYFCSDGCRAAYAAAHQV
jgi:hypothetical protein